MKWFQHLTGSGDDPDIDDSYTLFGSDGPWFFFRTLEVMADEFDVENPAINHFSVEFFRKKHRISWRKSLKVLAFFQKRERIFFELYDGEEMPMIMLNCPKLKELTDEYTKKILREKSGENTESHPDKVRPIEEEVEIEVEIDKKDTTDSSPTFVEIPLHKNGSFHRVTENDIATYRQSFPRLDVHQVLRNIRQYFLDNSAKRKTPRGIGRCISSWMMRDQDSGKNILTSGKQLTPSAPRQKPLNKFIVCPCGASYTLVNYRDVCPKCGWQYYRHHDGDWHVREPTGVVGPVDNLVSQIAEKRSA